MTNTITYTEGANFKADNYTITKNEGKLKITASEGALVITSSTKSWKYDGQTHKDEVYTVTYDGTAATADESGKVFTLSTGDTVTITATADAEHGRHGDDHRDGCRREGLQRGLQREQHVHLRSDEREQLQRCNCKRWYAEH